jgi:NADPH-dependent curcumin reductase CurA
MFDCISMEILDETTNDLSISLPMFSGCSDYSDFKSQPKRTSDKLHYFCLKNNRVVGSVSDEMSTDFDDFTVDLVGWIDGTVPDSSNRVVNKISNCWKPSLNLLYHSRV